MFSTLVNAWKIKDIRTKMLYTMLLIVIYRLGSFIPVPGVNAAAIANFANEYDMLGFLHLLSGRLRFLLPLPPVFRHHRFLQ